MNVSLGQFLSDILDYKTTILLFMFYIWVLYTDIGEILTVTVTKLSLSGSEYFKCFSPQPPPPLSSLEQWELMSHT